MSGFSDQLNAGQTLIYASLHSPDFIPGTSGWSINKDGTAEFSDVTVRGELIVVGPSGATIQIQPSIIDPQILFTSPDGSNSAFINIVPGSTNNADLGINSGKWTPVDGIPRRIRLYMVGSASNVGNFQVINDATQQNLGGLVTVKPDEGRIGYQDSTAGIVSDIKFNTSGIAQVNRVIQDSNPQTWVYQGNTFSQNITTETVMGTLSAFPFLAHRSYRIIFQFTGNCSSIFPSLIVRCRDTNISGTQRGIATIPSGNSTAVPYQYNGIFFVANTTGATITRTLAISAQASGGGTIAIATGLPSGGSQMPWYIYLEEYNSDTAAGWSVPL